MKNNGLSGADLGLFFRCGHCQTKVYPPSLAQVRIGGQGKLVIPDDVMVQCPGCTWGYCRTVVHYELDKEM